MSTGEYIKVCFEDLVKVESLIEQCLLHYMTQKQVIDILYQLQHIEPAFTETVWQKLEEQNQEFFQSYYLRVVVNEQIKEFNNLLGRQVALMNQVDPSVASFPPVSNVSHMPAMPHNGSYYASDTGIVVKTENMQPSVPTVLVNGFNNCGPFIHSGMQHALDRSTYSRRIDVPSNMVLAHNSDIRMMEGIVIKSEPGYLDNSRFVYQTGGDVLGAHPAIEHASISPFGSMDPNSQTFFRQISQKIGPPGLPADFTNLGPSTSHCVNSELGGLRIVHRVKI